MKSFPKDLLIEILSLLPVISLIRFRCVCKSWYTLLQSPDFIARHVSNSDNNVNDDHHRLIVGLKLTELELDDFRLLSYNTLSEIQGDFRFNLSRESEGWDNVRLLGSYNGLVCLSDEHLKEIAFWNPATRQFKFVISKLTRQQKLESKMEHAFGYDFKTKDYKVMKITTDLTNGVPYKYDIKVYSFNTGSWRNSGAVIPNKFCFDGSYERPTTCVSGICSTMAYTLAQNGEVRSYVLFTFDMTNEVFLVTQMPQAENFEARPLEARLWRNKALAELKGSVAFIKYQTGSSESEESFEIFVLNEYGPKGIWTKLHTIASFSETPITRPLYFHYPVGFWKNDELFLDMAAGRSFSYTPLFLCDARTREVKYLIKICGMWKQILEYKESLVWINDGDHCFGKKNKLESYPVFPNRHGRVIAGPH